MYFKRQVGKLTSIEENIPMMILSELSTMHRTMESKNYLSVEQAIEDLRKG